ncbi:hypothetical protein EDB81DRAFT_760520 [Dactylonectria macrodidyma]|uniref:Uncharacterized protein n=1 Tax=Dactylonectria macrodidyma TaxID=307937 RepID=A0A9P9ELF0_9HYPO|nr:hypothetical protein EDB81DRAFT_760520 [Dactylonectria macrodidyma]
MGPKVHNNRFPKGKEVTRAGAELHVDHIEAWFEEYHNNLIAFAIDQGSLWNFDETPFQIRWVRSRARIFYTCKRKNSRPTAFQPGNKESLASVDAVGASSRAIPSFLILTAKVLLEEYTHSTLDDKTILMHTDSGFNNAQRAVQWLQHFSFHSFAVGTSFGDPTIEEWFGFPSQGHQDGLPDARDGFVSSS